MAQGANAIGDASTPQNGQAALLNDFTKSLAHAMLGCAGGAATGGGCGAGAVGAVIGELASGFALDNGMTDSQATALAKTLGAAAGVLVGGGGANAAAVNAAATMAANAAENNRQLHKTESQKASQLAAQSGGKFTKKQIEDAMRNSGNSDLKEQASAGVVIRFDPADPDAAKSMEAQRYDKESQWRSGSDGKSLIQVEPNGGKVDTALAAYIIANTGGANSPYAWMDYQVGKVTPPVPTSGNNAFSAQYNYMGNSSAGMASGVSTDNRTQAQIDASLNQTVTGIATTPVWVPLVGAAAMYSPLGFGLGAGGDAAGQAYQSYSTTGEVTIRPAQSVFSGVTGAVALPLAGQLPAAGMSTVTGAKALAGNAAIGGTTGATNTQFNNVYYDEATSLYSAFGLGALLGGAGSVVGSWVAGQVGAYLPKAASIPAHGTVAPFAAQGTLNPMPSKIGNSVSNTIGAVPAFIPLDNGKNPSVTYTQEQSK